MESVDEATIQSDVIHGVLYRRLRLLSVVVLPLKN